MLYEISKNIRSVLNASIWSDLINKAKTKQELQLSFDVSHHDAIKHTKEDFQLGIKSLINNIDLKTKCGDKSTQTTCLLLIPIVKVLYIEICRYFS